MLCEYRSDSRECLEIMKGEFNRIFENVGTPKTEVVAELVGESPCAYVDEKTQHNLTLRCKKVCDETYGMDGYFPSGSTDCNIPLSIGIPAVNVGVYVGGKSHTREEWIEKGSILKGFVSLKRSEESSSQWRFFDFAYGYAQNDTQDICLC